MIEKLSIRKSSRDSSFHFYLFIENILPHMAKGMITDDSHGKRGLAIKRGDWAIFKFEGRIEMKEGGGHFEAGGGGVFQTLMYTMNT